MTKVYKDSTTKVFKGKFPKVINDIGKRYYCPTPWDKKDTTKGDSDEDSSPANASGGSGAPSD